MRRQPFVRHLSVGNLRYKYRSCRQPVEKTRWHALWLLARTDEPRTPAQVAALVGLSHVTVRVVLHRSCPGGAESILQLRVALLSEDDRSSRSFANRPGCPFRKRHRPDKRSVPHPAQTAA
jgi:hypothetical protein